jgi:hypothetical protein
MEIFIFFCGTKLLNYLEVHGPRGFVARVCGSKDWIVVAEAMMTID